MESFRTLDFLFNTDFKFSVFNKSSFKTRCGGILSIITITLGALMTYYFGKDLYYRTNPKGNFSKESNYDYIKFNLNKDNFLLYFQLQDNNGRKISIEPYLFFQTYYVQVNLSNKPEIYNYSYIESTQCDLSLVANTTFFSYKKLDQFNCLNLTNPKSDKKGYEIGGYWDGEFVDYFYMELSFCKSQTEDSKGNNCTDSKQISDFLYQNGSGAYLNLYLQSGHIIQNNLIQPLMNDYRVHFYPLDNLLKSRSQTNLFFEQINLSDDNGIILPKVNYFSTYSLNQEIISLQNINGTEADQSYYDSVIFLANIYLLKTSENYKRSFMKLQDLTAQIGGFINGVMIIFRILLKLFQNLEIKIIIINNIFDVTNIKSSEFENILEPGEIVRRLKSENNILFEIESKNSELKSEQMSEQHKSEHITERKLNSEIIIPSINDNDEFVSNRQLVKNKSEENKKDDFFKRKCLTAQNKIPDRNQTVRTMKKSRNYTTKLRKEEEVVDEVHYDISHFSLIKKFICQKCLNDEDKKKLSQLNYAESYIDKKLDIAYYLKQMIKFDYLLKMLLTKEERLLFNNPKKPPLKEFQSDKIRKLLNKDKKSLVDIYMKKRNAIKDKASVVDFLNPAVREYLSKKSGISDFNPNK